MEGYLNRFGYGILLTLLCHAWFAYRSNNSMINIFSHLISMLQLDLPPPSFDKRSICAYSRFIISLNIVYTYTLKERAFCYMKNHPVSPAQLSFCFDGGFIRVIISLAQFGVRRRETGTVGLCECDSLWIHLSMLPGK